MRGRTCTTGHGGSAFAPRYPLHPASAATIKASEERLPLLIPISLRGIARCDDLSRAADHHRTITRATREGSTNRGRGAGADVVGLISEHRDTGPTSNVNFTASSIAVSRVAPWPNGTEASKGAITISVKPAAVGMRTTCPGRRTKMDQALRDQAAPLLEGYRLIAPIARRTHSFSAALRQQTKATPPARPERAVAYVRKPLSGHRRTSPRNVRTGYQTHLPAVRRCWRPPPGTGPAHPAA